MIARLRHHWLVAGLAAVMAIGVASVATAQVSGGAFNLSWNALLPGGSSANAPYAEQGVIGQAVVGRSSQGQYGVSSGFLGVAGDVKYKRVVPNLSGDGLY